MKTQGNITCNIAFFSTLKFGILRVSLPRREMKLIECFPGTVADLHGHGRRQALSLEDLCLDNTRIKKMKRTGVGSGGRKELESTYQDLRGQFDKTATS